MNNDSYKDRLLETYKGLYFHELERKEEINGRFPLLLGVYSLLIGIAVSYLNTLPDKIDEGPGVAFIILLMFFTVAVIWSAGYAVKFLILDNHGSAYIRTPAGFNEYIDSLKEYNRSVSAVYAIDMDGETRDLLIEQYGSVATQNFHDNKDRHALLGKAVKRMILAAFLALASAVPYFAIKLHSARTVHHVVVTNLSKESIMRHDTEQKKPDMMKGNDVKPETDSNIPKKPERPGVLKLRDSETTKESKARRDNGKW